MAVYQSVRIEQMHSYRFVEKPGSACGAEWFELVQESRGFGVPYAETWYSRQVWTVTPVCHAGVPCCKVVVTIETIFPGPRPLVASLIISRTVADTRTSMKQWIDGARRVTIEMWPAAVSTQNASCEHYASVKGEDTFFSFTFKFLVLLTIASCLVCSALRIDTIARLAEPFVN